MAGLPTDIARVIFDAAKEAKADLRRAMDDLDDAIKESTSSPARMNDVFGDIIVLATRLRSTPYSVAAISLGDEGTTSMSQRVTAMVDEVESAIAKARESVGEEDMTQNVAALLSRSLELATVCAAVLLVTDAIVKGSRMDQSAQDR
jgi:hypothetical protein